MRLSTRFLLAVLPAVAVVTAGFGLWAVGSQQRAEVRELGRETAAYAAAAGMAVQQAARNGSSAPAVLEGLAREAPMTGFLVYDSAGGLLWAAGRAGRGDALPPAELASRRAGPRTATAERSVAGETVLSSLRPLEGLEDAAVLEVLASESVVRAARSRTSRQFLMEALLLTVVLTGVVVWFVRRFINRPLARFVEAVRRVGDGRFSQPIDRQPAGRELQQLAEEFNRMAARLQDARDTLLDETERRIDLETRVREAERAASIGTLAAGVAHQVASPLTVIVGRARRLLDRGVGDETVERNLETIEEQGRRISKVVRMLLDFARDPEPELRPVDVSRIVREECRTLEGRMEDMDIELRLEVPEAVWAEGDPNLLREAVDVLLTNAVHALEETDDRRVLSVRVGRGDDGVEVEVSDTGPGIPEQVRDRIYEPFVTTRSGGIGVGLTVARDVVEQLGGDLRAEAGPGPAKRTDEREARDRVGTTFRFRLPEAVPRPREEETDD